MDDWFQRQQAEQQKRYEEEQRRYREQEAERQRQIHIAAGWAANPMNVHSHNNPHSPFYRG